MSTAAPSPPSEVGHWKWVEVGLLVAAGIGFYWWQRRDLVRAKEDSQRQREMEASTVARSAAAKTDDAPPTEPAPPPAP